MCLIVKWKKLYFFSTIHKANAYRRFKLEVVVENNSFELKFCSNHNRMENTNKENVIDCHFVSEFESGEVQSVTESII